MELNWKGLRKEAPQPAVTQIRTFFPRIFPEVPQWRREGLVGGYNNKSFGGGHEYGLAADIYVRVIMPDEKRIGDGLFEMFKTHPELGVEKVIWNRQAWDLGSPTDESRPFRGDKPHTDHVHVRFTRTASQSASPKLVFLMKDLHDSLFGSLGSQP
jgi:hypothetical protein